MAELRIGCPLGGPAAGVGGVRGRAIGAHIAAALLGVWLSAGASDDAAMGAAALTPTATFPEIVPGAGVSQRITATQVTCTPPVGTNGPPPVPEPAALERVGHIIGGNDLPIAAQAVALGGTIVADKFREFSRVQGLAIENRLR